MATKSVSTFAIFIILVLVIIGIPEIEAQDSECLKEYGVDDDGEDVGFRFCATRIFPTLCYRRCQKDKGAKGGKCRWEEVGSRNVKCLCDFCSEDPSNQFISLT
ncbi:Knottin scorpion toxin-like [Arabidopsis suecica]|uniref:Knottin scorpion toxin-like n=1 Tax=Arabidopsis suecica TaxID=45249 RepID=A0A8T2AMV9_ARASU|nr:Knottin scorpion toxin-like [Arabidopsis suecica]